MGLTGKQVSVFFACLVLGLILTIQFRTAQKLQPNIDIKRANVLNAQIKDVARQRDALKNRAAKLRLSLAAGQAKDKKVLAQARLLAGLVPVRGPGVQVTLNDSARTIQPGEDPNLYLVHDEDLLKVLNAVKAAGAEAVSVNGLRIMPTTEVACAGTTILTGAIKLVPPFAISAIGDPNKMASALLVSGGILETLKFWDLRVDLEKKTDLTIPGYTGGVQFQYAKPLKEGKEDED